MKIVIVPSGRITTNHPVCYQILHWNGHVLWDDFHEILGLDDVPTDFKLHILEVADHIEVHSLPVSPIAIHAVLWSIYSVQSGKSISEAPEIVLRVG